MKNKSFLTIYKGNERTEDDILSLNHSYEESFHLAKEIATSYMEQHYENHPMLSISDIYNLDRPVNWRSSKCIVKGYILNGKNIEKISREYSKEMIPFASGIQIMSKLKVESKSTKNNTYICTVIDENEIGLFTIIAKNGAITIQKAISLDFLHEDSLESDWVQAVDAFVKQHVKDFNFLEPVTPKQMNYQKNGNQKEFSLLAIMTYFKDGIIVFEKGKKYVVKYEQDNAKYFIENENGKKFYPRSNRFNIETGFLKI